MTRAAMNVEPPIHVAMPYGLASVVEWRDADNHWKNGIIWQTLCGGGGTTYDPCIAVTGTGGDAGNPPAKADNIDRLIRGATPFTAFAEIDCSPPGHWDDADDLVRQALIQTEAWQVERAFWTGTAGGQETVFPHLAADAEVIAPDSMVEVQLQPAATVVTGSAVDVVQGLGLLERELGNCLTGRGIIHVPAELLSHLVAWNLVFRVGTQMQTHAGNLVAVGQGYNGTSPSGAAPPNGFTWMYATGPMFGYRGNIFVIPRRESLDRDVNTVKSIAERTFLLGFDCCLLAIQVSTGGVISGGPGAT